MGTLSNINEELKKEKKEAPTNKEKVRDFFKKLIHSQVESHVQREFRLNELVEKIFYFYNRAKLPEEDMEWMTECLNTSFDEITEQQKKQLRKKTKEKLNYLRNQ